MNHDPTRGLGQGSFKFERGGSGQYILESHGSCPVWSRDLKISPVWSGSVQEVFGNLADRVGS